MPPVILVWLLSLASAFARYPLDTGGLYGDVLAGGALGLGLQPSWQAGAGIWLGSFDERLLAGRYVTLGARLRQEALHSTATSALVEVRSAAEFLGGTTWLGVCGGPEWSGPTAHPLILGAAGLHWRTWGDHAGPTVRLEVGASRSESWRARGALVVGIGGRVVLNEPGE